MEELKEVLASLSLGSGAGKAAESRPSTSRASEERHWSLNHPYKALDPGARRPPLKGATREAGEAAAEVLGRAEAVLSRPEGRAESGPEALGALRRLSEWLGPDELLVLPLRPPRTSKAAGGSAGGSSCAAEAAAAAGASDEADLQRLLSSVSLSQMSNMALSMYS